MFAISCFLMPWSLDRKTGVTKLLFGKNNKTSRLTDAQRRFVRNYPRVRTTLSFLIFLSGVSLYATWDEKNSLLFAGSLAGLVTTLAVLLYVIYRAGFLAIKTLSK